MADARTIAITGGTGFVGRHIIRELLGRGHAVRALARAPETAGLGANVTLVQGGFSDEIALQELVRGCDACIHLIGIIREASDGQTFERVHVGATRNILKACEAQRVSRYLHMSAMGARPDGKAAYQRTKFEGERLVQASGLDWTIFRPGLIHGPGGEFIQMVQAMASGEMPPYLFMPYFVRATMDTSVPLGAISWESASVAPVFVENVARAFAEAIERDDTAHEIYNLAGDDEMTWPELYRVLRDELPGTNKKMQPWHVPGLHARAIAHAATAVGLGALLPFDAGQAHMAEQDSTADLSKARAHLGFDPSPFRETVRDYASRV